MGAGVCCVQKRLDFSVDWISENLAPIHSEHQEDGYGSSTSSFAPRAADVKAAGFGSHSSLSGHIRREDDFAEEIAFQIATDRRQQLIEAASLLPVLYEIRPPSPEEPAHTAVAVHRKTEVPRQLSSFRRPAGAAAQERMHSFILSLQRLSATCDALARVFEVFEDYMTLHVVSEHCSGGSIYERILERQYFTEQESAVLVKHMLEAMVPFHDNHLFHGSLTPDSFRFLNNSPHAPLKLIDYGIELKAHRWDAVEHVTGGPDLQNPCLPHFFETCKLVFCAPELAPPQQPRRKKDQPAAQPGADISAALDSLGANLYADPEVSGRDLLDEDLLAHVLNEHSDWVEEQRMNHDISADYSKRLEVADIWSIGAIAFLLLCGYPPFFAPSRNAILGRIQRSEVAFDPPFWSKISEEAKSFVSGCLQQSCWDRFSVQEALNHPWIQRLADSSPSGSMFASFMLNLRRFYRTSLIEMYVANIIATKFRREELQDFVRRCKEIDMCSTGFFTASDLKHVMVALGHPQIGEAISVRFLQTFRHPGESYIDYMALLDSILLRQHRIFEDELWRHFQRVCQSNGRCGDDGASSSLSINDLGIVFSDPVIVGLLMQEIPESPGLEEASVCHRLQATLHAHCQARDLSRLDFRGLASLLLQQLRLFVPRDISITSDSDSRQAGGVPITM
eukprot:TRINITY_DN24551_c0_g1_i1.p1 TRINITY_DN24551_c0_g1~~TRINITY_DN24551_c0_g1_i1.p1  ORF type:complete len:678 (-),score=127.26 TRINITY_DN24551_c0_g1_i1:28-2061(-)